jgi:hypothetical protein
MLYTGGTLYGVTAGNVEQQFKTKYGTIFSMTR